MTQSRQERDGHEEYIVQSEDEYESPLPPTDKGLGAWKCLAGCFLLEGMLWSLTLTFGVFQKHYSQHELFASNGRAVPVVGTLSAAMCYFGVPIVTPLTRLYPQYNVYFVWIGWAVCLISLILASFATNVWQLMLTQGFCYGFGWALCYTPFLLILNQWFILKRGAVYGILFSSSGVCAMLLPFGLEASLERYDFRTTLRLTAAATLFITAPAFFLIRPRIKANKGQIGRSPDGLRSLLGPTMCIFCVAIFFQGLGWFLPRFFLPTFAHDLSLSHTQGAATLATFGFAQTGGQLTFGWASDRINIYIPMALSSGGSALAVLLLWGPAKGIVRLICFTLLYGSLGGGFTVLWARMSLHCTTNEKDISTIYSLFSVMRGLGNVASGPLSSLLLLDSIDGAMYGLERYRNVVGFVGVAMMLSAGCSVNYFFGGKGASAVLATEKADESSPSSDVFLLSDQGD